MKKHDLFEELLNILSMYYNVHRTEDKKAIIRPIESKNYITLDWNDGVLTVTVNEDDILVFHMEDKQDVGIRTLDIENIMIDRFKLGHQPIALALYLYYMLFGILWGARADKKIRNQNPVPVNQTYIELYGNTKDGAELIYVYTVDKTGAIRVEEYSDKTTSQTSYTFYPIEYINDPIGTAEKFFNFFNKITSITKCGRG